MVRLDEPALTIRMKLMRTGPHMLLRLAEYFTRNQPRLNIEYVFAKVSNLCLLHHKLGRTNA